MGSSDRSEVDAPIADERVFTGASYLDLSEADADFEALRQLYIDLGVAQSFDAVTIGRKASGEVRFHRESDRHDESTEHEHAAPGLASGLGAALFPSVAADIPVGRRAERRILGTVAGVVVIALGRSGLAELGIHLDRSPAGLIVAAAAQQQESVLANLTNARDTITRSAAVATGPIEQLNEYLRGTASGVQRMTS